ncbi:MAG: hypothetical protein EA384_03365 [Spirochaetaceae bacterium]|nr:MAG: hypothetical protein EA384_03365 [Spirochaetaceae bacterium]
MARGADFAALLRNPTEIHFSVDTSPPAPATTASIGDLHAVYPVPLDIMRQVITDYNAYPEFAPRVTNSQAVRIGDDPPTWRHHLTLSFQVLFFGSGYDYYLTVVEPPLGAHNYGPRSAVPGSAVPGSGPETSAAERRWVEAQSGNPGSGPAAGCRAQGGEFAMYYRMDRSLDGQLVDVAGSWYLCAVEIDGVEHTYARYFNSISFARDQFGLRVALRNLGARDMKSAMDAFYHEAERRMQ